MSISGSSVTNLPDGRFQFGFSIPGALQATVLTSTNLADWEVLQVVPLIDGSAVFTDDAVTNHPNRFYRLRLPY